MMRCDLLVIGAGPAGMTAATTAADAGAVVVMLDEQPQVGGQIFRAILAGNGQRDLVLGPDYTAGRVMARTAQNHPRIQHEAGAVVWHLGADGRATFSRDGTAQQVQAKQVIIATGALERSMPVPGWTLPGVITAGAAQIMIKSSGIVATDAVLVGAGPLLYLLAAQMIAAGAPPKALVETQTKTSLLAAVRFGGGAIKGWRAMAKGLGLIRTIRRAGVARYIGARGIRILGEGAASGIEFCHWGRQHQIDARHIFLHQGVVPNTQMSRALQLDHGWSKTQRCFVPVINKWGETSLPGIYIAGDGAAINGAVAAALAGQIAALEVLRALGMITEPERDAKAARPIRLLRRERALRPLIDTLYPPLGEALVPSDEVIICRCEEVTAGEIRRIAKLGCVGPNQTKAFGRCGMGQCQGRYCALAVTEILAAETGRTPQQVGSYRIRSPIKPITLGEMANLDD